MSSAFVTQQVAPVAAANSKSLRVPSSSYRIAEDATTKTSSSSSSSVPSTGLAAFVMGGAAMLVAGKKRSSRDAQHSGKANVIRNFFLQQQEPEPPPKPVFNPALQIGAVAPLGYFDPAGFCKMGDEETFNKLRSNEIKHGRVAMMASVGLLGGHFAGAHGSIGSIYTDWGVFGFIVLLMGTGVIESIYQEAPGAEPGNLGDPAGFGMYTTDMRTKEINNGRMAMLSVLGIFAAEFATGKDALQQFGF
eukprot:TRINITY_DN599_c0_g1_i1.p1 TRINITY_DN599_c0_g1~~TRINITY_DN599_c0_g1_i1.p1  ORF type:complete len:278 (-),score=86.20 TRINITY_DN599_c0_g1_i1:366-1109(-)